MSDSTYNGWTNYATWRVNLEICDDITSSMLGEQAFDSVYELAEYLEQAVDDVLTNFGEIEQGIALDYARSFVSDVNWHEIAEAHADELVSDSLESDDDG